MFALSRDAHFAERCMRRGEQIETLKDIRELGVKLRKVYYKGYQRALELGCSTPYLVLINGLNYYILMTEPGNELENMLRLSCVWRRNKCYVFVCEAIFISGI